MPDIDPTPSAPEAPATPSPESNTSLLGGDPAAPAAPAAPADPAPEGDWPEDWRQKYSAGDEKIIKRLERYGSPKAAIDALFAAQAKISSGELKTALKPDATPEELTAWRADNGVPEKPEDYELGLPNGLVIGDADKPIVDDFLKAAHEANLHPSQVNQALGWYFDKQEQAFAEQAARDEEARIHAEDELRQEFGPEYRRNLEIARNFLKGAPESVREKLETGRAADGTPLGNDPDIIRWMVGLSREMNPLATVVPGSGTNAAQAVESELSNLRSLMGDHKSAYWKGPEAQKMQARYRELVGALDKTKARAA